jgi:hypothetical protein
MQLGSDPKDASEPGTIRVHSITSRLRFLEIFFECNRIIIDIVSFFGYASIGEVNGMKNRDLYLTQLIQFKDKKLIKVITGLRRSGKSTLLSLFENHLITSGVDKNHIIRMNFESFEFDEITSHKELHAYIKERIHDTSKKHYDCTPKS